MTPKLQTSGGLCDFLHDYLGHPVPSPALLKPRHDRFVAAVQHFAATQRLEVVPFERGESKDVRVAKDRARFTAPEGVVFIGVAQEKMRSFKAHQRQGHGHTPVFDFSRQSVAVNHYYFYVQDRDWGPAFLKIGTYLPYPVKLCLNGHEWVKQRLRRDRIRFESLDNGFLSCADPTALQAACDALGPADVQAFFDRWSHCLPWPMTADERAAGYDHRLAICQFEVKPVKDSLNGSVEPGSSAVELIEVLHVDGHTSHFQPQIIKLLRPTAVCHGGARGDVHRVWWAAPILGIGL